MTSAAQNRYEYGYLEVGQFRLFELEPSTEYTADIVGRLCAVGIESVPKFRVLSYLWGPTGQWSFINHDDCTISVPPNFLDAARAIRHQSECQLLWADCICINQHDSAERLTQISMMPKITFSATEVVLHVNSESKNVEAALELVTQLTAAKQRILPRSRPLSSLHAILKHSDIQRYRQELPSSASSGWKAVNELLQSTAFERVWTICDLIYSRRLTLRWGRSYKLDAQEFCLALETYELYSHPNLIRSPRARTLIDAERLRQRCGAGKMDNGLFFSGLKLSFPLSCTQAMDRIYAVLGLLTLSGLSPSTITDQTGQNGHVYYQTALVLNLIDPTSPFISMSLSGNTARPAVQRGHLSGLPSWVPDWTDPQELIYQLNEPANTFHASDGYLVLPRSSQLNPNYKAETIMTNNGEPIFLALMIDVLDQVSGYNPPRRPADRFNVAVMNSLFFSEWWEWVQQRVPDKYKNSEQRLLQDWVETIQAIAPNKVPQDAKRVSTLPRIAKSLLAPITAHRDAKEVSRHLAIARSWLALLVDEKQEETEDIRQFHAACLPSCGRRLAITRRGNLCLVPRNARPGDIVCIPKASKVPFVFREIDLEKDHYENVGECYVHGAMSGEAVKWEGIREAKITLF